MDANFGELTTKTHLVTSTLVNLNVFNNKQGTLGEETGELMVIHQILQSFPLFLG